MNVSSIYIKNMQLVMSIYCIYMSQLSVSNVAGAQQLGLLWTLVTLTFSVFHNCITVKTFIAECI